MESDKTIGDGTGSEKEVREITKQEFETMTPAQQNDTLIKMVKIEGKAVVRRADGSIKYDDISLKGTYGEG